jgi:protein gp37
MGAVRFLRSAEAKAWVPRSLVPASRVYLLSDNPGIEWCDATWHPIRGGVEGEQGVDLRLVPAKLTEPFSWKKRRRIFVNSISDLFQDGVPDSFIDQVFAVMALAPRHTFQVLTKRVQRMRAYLSDDALFTRIVEACNRRPDGSEAVSGSTASLTTLARGVHREPHLMQWPLMNVWLGVSVENQNSADERIPLLLQTPAAVRFLSCAPLIEAVDLRHYIGLAGAHRGDFRQQRRVGDDKWSGGFTGRSTHSDPRYAPEPDLDWVIVGVESGPGARPFDLAWARSIVAQCKAAGVPVFVKPLAARPETDGMRDANGHEARGPRWLVLDNKKGGDNSEWPEDLRVREFPEARR